jgi:hypothetical protein
MVMADFPRSCRSLYGSFTGTAVAESSEQLNAAGGNGCDLEEARTVALGWALSGRSQRAMSCLIAHHRAIGELAAELELAN